MRLTGGALVFSGAVDVFVIYDFIRNDGAYVGLAITLAQTIFVLIIGIAATFGRIGVQPDDDLPAAQQNDTEDTQILAQLEALFADKIHRDEDLSLRKLARRLGVPDRRVSGAVNKTHGVNVSQYVNGYRIKDACACLTQTDQSVLQISLLVGFTSKSNFNREFVRVTGETPTSWRKRTQ
jgi:AraC-like DNA-binding protein